MTTIRPITIITDNNGWYNNNNDCNYTNTIVKIIATATVKAALVFSNIFIANADHEILPIKDSLESLT